MGMVMVLNRSNPAVSDKENLEEAIRGAILVIVNHLHLNLCALL